MANNSLKYRVNNFKWLPLNSVLTYMKKYNGYTVDQIIEFGRERKSKIDFKSNKLDLLGSVFLFESSVGGRKSPITSGYRPQHEIQENYHTSGEHIYFENEILFPGERALAYVKFIMPEAHPRVIHIGQILNLLEGSRIVGEITILEVYNEILMASSEAKRN